MLNGTLSRSHPITKLNMHNIFATVCFFYNFFKMVFETVFCSFIGFLNVQHINSEYKDGG